MNRFILALSIVLCACASTPKREPRPLVLTTDFSLRDGAVSAMKGVAYNVSPTLVVADLTHEIPAYNIWEAAYRLQQTFAFWPVGTVFVTVVDPGVGSSRKSIVARTRDGRYFVGPDNGHLTLIEDEVGFETVRVLDESRHRRQGSDQSYTFHGRDLYVFVGAQLAAGQLAFDQLGPELKDPVRLPYQKPELRFGELFGTIPVLDVNYGNVWTNLSKEIMTKYFKLDRPLKVTIRNETKVIYQGRLPVVNTFSDVAPGKPLLYFNSLMNLSLALNQDSFARKFKINSGPNWTIIIAQ